MKKVFWLRAIAVATLMVMLFCSFSAIKSKEQSKPPASPGIKFVESNFKKALAQSKKQNKYLFIDLYATWCGPCKQLKKTSFADTGAASFYNSNFVNVSIDVEKGAGPELAKIYRINALPTLIIADTTGSVIAYTQGFVSAERLVQFGKDALLEKKQ